MSETTPFFHAPPPRSIFSLAAYKATLPALSEALGVALPLTPRAVRAGGALYLWNGPRQWLVLDAPDLPARAGALAAVTAQGDGLALFALAGERAVPILKRLLPIDVALFAPDEVALTRAGQIGVRLWREGDDYILACFRGFSDALRMALVEAAAGAFPPQG